jgi:hypothetical protein
MAVEARVRPWFYATGALLLGVGGAALVLLRDLGSLEPHLVALILGGTSGISFVVGYVMGYIAEGGLGPGPKDDG